MEEYIIQGYQFEICLRIRGPNVTNPRKYGLMTVECLLLKKKKIKKNVGKYKQLHYLLKILLFSCYCDLLTLKMMNLANVLSVLTDQLHCQLTRGEKTACSPVLVCFFWGIVIRKKKEDLVVLVSLE